MNESAPRSESGAQSESGPQPESVPPAPNRSKATILAVSLADLALDLFLPTLVFLALRPSGLPDAICLTVGGYALVAKVGMGRLADIGPDRRRVATPLVTNALLALAATAITIGLSVAGTSTIVAIIAGTVPLAVIQGASLLRSRRRLDRRRLDPFALLVLAELATSIVLVSISDDPRWLLLRPSFYTAVAGLFVLATALTARPFMIDASKPMAVSGDPVRAEAFERAAATASGFLAVERLMTVILGAGLLVEAVLRVVVVLRLPDADLATLSLSAQIPSIVVLIVVVLAIRALIPRAARAVDALMPDVRTPGLSATTL